jgi:hypothetical protein
MRSSRRRGQRGQVVPIVALFLVVLTGFVAIVVDAGAGYTASRHGRDVADASALAAAYSIWATLEAAPAATSLTAATTAAGAAAERNSCDADGDGEGSEETTFGSCVAATPVYLASDNVTVTASAQTAAYVKVVVSDASPNGFAALSAGGHSITESVTSEAAVTSSTVRGNGNDLSCQLCVLGSVSFNNATLDITTTAGNIVIDGNLTSCCSGPALTASSPHTIDVQGTITGQTPQYCSNTVAPWPPAGTCTTQAVLKTGAFVDPGISAPITTGLTVKAAWSGDGTINPGIYPSISSGSGTLTLTAGVYVITGAATGFAINGGTIAATAGVTLYFACASFPTPCTAGGQLGAGFTTPVKNSTLNLTAPSSGVANNLAVYFDPNNTATFSVGTTNFAGNISGAMYMPAGTIAVGSKGAAILGSPIVVQTVTMTGAGSHFGESVGSLHVGGNTWAPGGLFCLTTPPCRT